MMRMDLHIHTEHSFDCESSIAAIVRKSEEDGLDLIAICDHETLSAVTLARDYSERVQVIAASEINTEQGIHIVGLFLKDEIHSRHLLDVIDEIHSQKGLALLPHPFRKGKGLLYLKEESRGDITEITAEALSKIDLIELATPRCRPEEIIRTHEFLKTHSDIPQVAASDAHTLDEIGRAYLELDIEKTENEKELKAALLTAPRLLRFEIYRDEGTWEAPVSRQQNIKSDLIRRTGQLISEPIRKTVGNIYRKSSELISRKKETGKKTTL
ncbi:MAG: PHP-associated domain-containing protein [Candidatus Zixiibacteriota bacterium]